MDAFGRMTMQAAAWVELTATGSALSAPHARAAHRDRDPRVRSVRLMRRLDRALARLPLIAVTFFAKLSVPPFGAMGLSLSIPLVFAATAVGAATGRLVVDPRRLFAFCAVMSLLVGLQMLGGQVYSAPSLALLVILHLPYVLRLAHPARHYEAVLRHFQIVACVIALCGIAQYLLQFAVGPQFAFPVENFLPSDLLVAKYNALATTEYGSAVLRANGVFMLEPSFFSQLLAVAIVVELTAFRRAWALAVLGTALVVSYSGTGLVVLAVCLPIYALRQRQWKVGVGAGALALLFAGLASFPADVPQIASFLKRAGEFSSTGSSGFARFVGGFYLFEQWLWPEPLRALFGFGAGSFQAYASKAPWAIAEMALFKMVFEFGVVGATAYFGFIGYCVATSRAPVLVRLAVGTTYFLSGIYIPFAHGLALTLLLWGAPPAASRTLAVSRPGDAA